MKRIWAAAAMILLAVGVSAGETLYFDTSTRLCVEMLDEADQLMEKNEVAEAASLAGRLENRFNSQSAGYDVFLFHSDVLEVSAGLAMLRRYAQVGDASEYLAASARIRRILCSMRGALSPEPANIL